MTIPVGNIRTQRLHEILGDSEVLENLRAFHGNVKEPCRTCSKTTDCYGCRGAAYQLTGDYLAGDSHCWKATGVTISALPVAVAGLIPHGPSMRVVDELVEVGDRIAHTTYKVSGESPLVDEAGRLDDLAYVEMIAQSYAAVHGFHPPVGDTQVLQGFLLGVKNLRISGEARVGETLRISVHKAVRFGDFCFIEGRICHGDGRVIAQGEVKLWRPGE
jgi:radical SAM protein with 4Fe4S-binding SPASM domain